jgi:hypothetical protein
VKDAPPFFDAVFATIAPAHARRKKARSLKPVLRYDFSAPFPARETNSTPHAVQRSSQLQAAHNARYADEMRSALC